MFARLSSILLPGPNLWPALAKKKRKSGFEFLKNIYTSLFFGMWKRYDGIIFSICDRTNSAILAFTSFHSNSKTGFLEQAN